MSLADYTPNGSRAKLRVAVLAPPWIPVPPPAYGGIESVVALLCEGHVRRGHDVTLFAPPGSSSSARVVSPLEEPHPQRINFTLDEADHVAFALEQIQRAADEGAPYDVIHDHCGYVTVAFADRVEVPVVHTVHGPFNEDNVAFYERHGPKVGIACLSRYQLDHAPVECELARVVPNPIDADRWPFEAEKDGYLLWIGRMHPDKGAARAIDAAREAGLPLVLAGPVQPGQEAYFSDEVEPRIDGDAVRYAGEVDCDEKRCLFARARALLMPIRWPEPFGMVMVEALASGTPVIAFPEGAAPEIVRHGETGMLVGDESEMAAAARTLDLAPEACRRSVLERYDTDRVAELYENFYREAIGSRERVDARSVARI
jgi:glycosyltransferase involved in cell wall biosynthesis